MNKYHFVAAIICFGVLMFYSCKEEYRPTAKHEKKEKLTTVTDKINFTNLEYSKEYGSCENKDSACIKIQINYPRFTADIWSNVVDSLNETVSSFITSPNFEDTSFQTLDELSLHMIDDYKSLIKEYPGYIFHWYNKRNVSVIFKNDNFLSLELSEVSFTGGAHPNYLTILKTFSLVDGSTLVLGDLIHESSLDSMIQLGEKKFKTAKEIPVDSTLSSAGFWFENDKFYLPTNFALLEEGLKFFYDTYEIAPYSFGPTTLLFKKDELKPYVNPKLNIW